MLFRSIPLAILCFRNPRVNDFRSFYSGGSALNAGHLANLYRQQREAASQPLEMAFIRPPVYALVHAPLALLPFTAAFCLWVALQSVLFLFLVFRAQSIRKTAVVACLFPPALIAIGQGQDAVLFLCVLVASYFLFRQRKELPAGLVLGLGLFKFHLFFLWPLVLAAQKRWRAPGAFCIVASAFTAGSIALVGMQGIRDYLAILARPALTSPHMPEEVGIGGLMAKMQLFSLPVQLALGFVIALVAINAIRRSRMEWVFAIVPAASLFITPTRSITTPLFSCFRSG